MTRGKLKRQYWIQRLNPSSCPQYTRVRGNLEVYQSGALVVTVILLVSCPGVNTTRDSGSFTKSERRLRRLNWRNRPWRLMSQVLLLFLPRRLVSSWLMVTDVPDVCICWQPTGLRFERQEIFPVTSKSRGA